MSTTDGTMVTCDRPGCKSFIFDSGPEVAIPDDWGLAFSPPLVSIPERQWILCPSCKEKYQSMWYQFLRIHKEEVHAND